MSRQPVSSRSSQRASVLITTLILLIMLTVLALGMLSLNTTQTRIATNTADAQQAYQTAEGALNQASLNVQSGSYAMADFLANTNGLYLFDSATAALWTTLTDAGAGTGGWSDAASAIQCTTCGASTNASYIIEYLPPVAVPGSGPKRAYRITAHATGISGNSPVMLQGTVLTP